MPIKLDPSTDGGSLLARERLVATHIKPCLPPSFDPHQFAYRANRSTEDAIAIGHHSTLSHLEHSGNYVRLLFIDFSSAFNTIILDILINKLWTSCATDQSTLDSAPISPPPHTQHWLFQGLSAEPTSVSTIYI
jgi:hypothetical protein